MNKSFFAGANTPNGFMNFFEQVYDKKEMEKVYIIKGGSGVGKSTALKKISKHFEDKGFFVEKILCGSDVNSLDGLHVPELKIAFFDGTAPHAMEATVPVICEELLDFAQFLNEKNLKSKKNIILKLLESKKKCYEKCYSYLKSGDFISNINIEIYKNISNIEVIKKEGIGLVNSLISEKKELVRNRCLTGESFSFLGFNDVTNELLLDYKVHTTNGINIYANHVFMKSVVEIANEKNYSCDVLVSAFNPDLIKTVIIKGANVAFTNNKNEEYSKIDTGLWLNNIIKKDELIIKENNELIENILKNGKKCLEEAFMHHEKIEKIYSSNMNFQKCDKLINKIIKKY